MAGVWYCHVVPYNQTDPNFFMFPSLNSEVTLTSMLFELQNLLVESNERLLVTREVLNFDGVEIVVLF